MIAKAEGLAIISVIKAGFMVTARAGSGIVIARLADRRKFPKLGPAQVGPAFAVSDGSGRRFGGVCVAMATRTSSV